MIKNVIIVADYAYIEGGASRVAIQTAVELAKKTTLNIIFFAGCGEPCEELLENGITVKSIGMMDLLGNPNRINAAINGIFNRKASVELEKILLTMNLKETIVHIHSWTKVLSSSVFLTCNNMGVKTFLTVHDYFLACPNGAFYNYAKRSICQVIPLSIKCLLCNCDSRNYGHKIWRCLRQYRQNSIIFNFEKLQYIFVSDFQKKQLSKRIKQMNNGVVLRNIVDYCLPKRVECENNDLYIYIGRVCKEKGTDLFCKSIVKANVKGVVIGDGPMLSLLEEEYNSIQFTGWLSKEDILSWLGKARVVVFTSMWYEGAPLVIGEAQTNGIPCIVTNQSAAVDEIVDGENGFICSPNVEEIAECISKTYEDGTIKLMSELTYMKFCDIQKMKCKYVETLLEKYEEL